MPKAPPEKRSTTEASKESGIRIIAVRIRNFRCFRGVTVPLHKTTLLIGENNVGKTSFIDAIHAAIGAGTKSLLQEDVFISNSEDSAPKDRDITIDLLIKPASESGATLEAFPEGSAWTELWGNGISQDDNGHDHVIIRTKLSWVALKADYVLDRHFLKEWAETEQDAQNAQKMNAPLGAQQIEPLALFALDAKRDVVDDLRTRSSLWGKLVSDPGLSADAIAEIENALSTLNQSIVEQSEVLSHVQTHLHTVSNILQCDKDGISITPVARHLRDLNRGMDVRLSMKDASSFPLSRQGMGTRSLTTMLLFRAYMTWKQKMRSDDAIHPFVSIEEPEVHLHPHAQRALFQQIKTIPGQKLVSTHSPYICSQAHITEFLHFMKDGSETRITWFDSLDPETGKPLLAPEDIRRIDREVMNTRGDILFCRCMVLFEGETEEQAIPGFARNYWNQHPNELGISFVGVGGYGNYLPFLRLAIAFRIPWVILSDGEDNAVKAVDAALKKAKQPKSAANSRVVILPDGHDFESYLVADHESYPEVVRKAIVDNAATNEHHKKALTSFWSKKTTEELVAEMRSAKTQYGARLPHGFETHAPAGLQIPKLILKVLDLAHPPTTST